MHRALLYGNVQAEEDITQFGILQNCNFPYLPALESQILSLELVYVAEIEPERNEIPQHHFILIFRVERLYFERTRENFVKMMMIMLSQPFCYSLLVFWRMYHEKHPRFQNIYIYIFNSRREQD